MRRVTIAAGIGVVALPLGLVGAATSSSSGRAAAVGFDSSTLHGEIPQPMLAAYLDAAEVWDLDWALLAAIGKVECDHGRYPAPGCWPPGTTNHAGARGPMQFLGSTWRFTADRHTPDVAGPPAPHGHGYATDGDGDGVADPWNSFDAAHSAARFLVDLGGRDDPRLAAKRYNAGAANPDPTAGEGYATRVTDLIARYHHLAGSGGPGAPPAAIVTDSYALPFDPAALHAATTHRTPPRDPEWQLVKPHHSGRVGADIPLAVGTRLYALFDGTVRWAAQAGKCGLGVAIHNPAQQATVTYCHLSRLATPAGRRVAAGEHLGWSGGAPGAPGAGNSAGPHLHLHIDTPSGRRCPQGLLLGLWRRWPVPTIAGLRTTGCTYTHTPPAPLSPVPVPPDLPTPTQPTP